MVSTLQSAYFAEFAQSIADCFASLLTTANTAWDTPNQSSRGVELDVKKTELELDHTVIQRHCLESDEHSQVDLFTSCSGTPPTLSFPPVSTIVCHSATNPNSRRRGRGRVGTPSNDCSRIGRSSGAARNLTGGSGCYSGPKLSSRKTSGKSKTQSPKMERDVESSQSGTVSAPVPPSANPLFGTVQIINRAGQLRLLKAEVDPQSPCTIISQEFLDRCLPKIPVDALKQIPKSCDKRLIPTLQGTIKLRVRLQDRVVRITAYVAAIRHSRIGRDLFSELESRAACGRGSQSGGLPAYVQHSTEPPLSHRAVKSTQTGTNTNTPSGCVSVPGAKLMQSKYVPRAEHVDGREHIPLTVDRGLGPHTVQTALCKPLFSVGSLVIARRISGTREPRANRNLMQVEAVLGRYDYILSDGKHWSARRLVRVRGTRMKTKTQRAADR